MHTVTARVTLYTVVTDTESDYMWMTLFRQHKMLSYTFTLAISHTGEFVTDKAVWKTLSSFGAVCSRLCVLSAETHINADRPAGHVVHK